ncbi:gamma-glutamyl phosphate reductase [Ascobolus immersus RN42]|uniref:glutamate-5-semialdehyde dehydrogenase n=1 Tax=Ascobolus immersus RN42 TaxID=1160509 RepID=A0A3N4IJG3_ASCIM|nr:gamma-glutamyl phosphate reductase [Ascobolus immersus RN42]
MTSRAFALAKESVEAYVSIKSTTLEERNAALQHIFDSLVEQKAAILEANKKDVVDATVKVSKGELSGSLLSRLDLSSGMKYQQMLDSILEIKRMEDPIGKISLGTRLDEGLDLFRVTSPIGVILIIFEARPEVIANISALCIKTGNSVILKGGKEAASSMAAIGKAISCAMGKTSISNKAVQIVQSHADVAELLKQEASIDLVIPRGSKSLVKYIKDNTRIPVMGHADGICSIYLHASAKREIAIKVVLDSKLNYMAACNAVETLLYDKELSTTILPAVCAELASKGCELRCDQFTYSLVKQLPGVVTASPDDFDTEFLGPTIAIQAVDSLSAAIAHINEHSSGHTDCIVTEDEVVADAFLRQVDSAGVFWNASTRFADGFRYGFGAEIGISTNKLHARGPVGLEGLTTYKYILKGAGQCVNQYSTPAAFKHESLLNPTRT